MHEACNHGHYNVALMLVKAGSNVNAKGLDDDTPLHDAAIMGQLKLVKLLVERGADPSFKNKKGKTPCDVASAPSVYNYLMSAKGELVFVCIFFLLSVLRSIDNGRSLNRNLYRCDGQSFHINLLLKKL